MNKLHSIHSIDKRYSTGEEPVLVQCNDQNSYVCKYSRYSGSANKLVCELIGSVFAKDWQLNTPNIAIVKVLSHHIPSYMGGSYFSKPLLGSQLRHNVIDITPSSVEQVPSNEKLLSQLMHIALFDFWIANEDRNANNSNLMYDYVRQELVVIDFGCCLNTATFDFPLSQLTETDSILCSELFEHVSKDIPRQRILQMSEILTHIDFRSYLHDCQNNALVLECDEGANKDMGVDFIPSAWNINRRRLKTKLDELFDSCWTDSVLENFKETLNTALSHE